MENYYNDFYKKCFEYSKLSKEIQEFYELLDYLDSNFFSSPRMVSVSSPVFYVDYGIRASLRTLHGIKQLCLMGNIIDANVLIRKLRDNLFFDLYRLELTLNKNIKLDSKYKLEDCINDEKLIIEMLNEFYQASKEYENSDGGYEALRNWESNKKLTESDKEYLDYRAYKQNIEKRNKDVKECDDRFLNEIFKSINRSLNNFVHGNGKQYMNNDVHFRGVEATIQTFDQMSAILNMIQEVFLIELFLIDSTLLSTEEYMDYVECGMAPPEGCQYFVIYQVENLFQKLKIENIDLYEYLKSHNRYCMKAFSE